MLYRRSQGFALIDVLIAIGLMGVAAIIVGSIYPGVKLSRVSRGNLIAGSIAQAKMSELRATPFASLDVESDVSFGDADLSALRDGEAAYTVELFDADNDANVDDDIKKITVSVNWTEGGLEKNINLTSLSAETGLSP